MFRITVPASSANMGPGFDCMGVALALYNTVVIDPASRLIIRVEGAGAGRIPTGERNLVYTAYAKTMASWGKKPEPLCLTQRNCVPSTRGLGSSSTAIVAGILAACAMAGRTVDRQEVLSLATRMEGHPDNVAPAVMGGFTVSFVSGEETRCIRRDVPDAVSFVAMIPDFELSTRKAREVLKHEISRADAVFNLSRGAYLAAAMMRGDYAAAASAMEDRIHQNQRSALIPGYRHIREAALSAGAMAVYLSGAGPTLMAVVEQPQLPSFTLAMRDAAAAMEHAWEIRPLSACNSGAMMETE